MGCGREGLVVGGDFMARCVVGFGLSGMVHMVQVELVAMRICQWRGSFSLNTEFRLCLPPGVYSLPRES